MGRSSKPGTTRGFDFDDVPITESTFDNVQNVVEQLYFAAGATAEVRRRALEASVHAPRDWHAGAVRAAYSSDDDAWRLTAVFCMFYVEGFEQEILEALGDPNLAVRCEAMRSAGAWELQDAWPHVLAALADPRETHKSLVLAAINALPQIRPEATQEILADLVSSDDEEIARAADEALAFVLWPLANYRFGEEPQSH